MAEHWSGRAWERERGGAKGTSICFLRIAQKYIDELASPFFFAKQSSTGRALLFTVSRPANLALLLLDAVTRSLSSDRGCRRSIGRTERGGTAACRSSPHHQRAKRARARESQKKGRKKRSASNLVCRALRVFFLRLSASSSPVRWGKRRASEPLLSLFACSHFRFLSLSGRLWSFAWIETEAIRIGELANLKKHFLFLENSRR